MGESGDVERTAVAWRGPGAGQTGAAPGGIAAGEIYPLPNWTNAELVEIRREAGEMASQERARRGMAGGVGGGPAAPAAAGNVAPASPQESAVVGPYSDG